MSAGIYQSLPDPAPDSDFDAGELGYLVAGNHGRLLDARRTPVTVTAVRPQTGAFEVEIGAFEDAGARWELSLDQVRRFQFARGSRVAEAAVLAELEQAAARFDRELVVEADRLARDTTWRRIAAEREAVRERLQTVLGGIDADAHITRREGDERLFALLEETIAARGLADLERRFSTALVSNPRAGEFVKGHAIVLAELGLCPYRGQVVRDPGCVRRDVSKDRRAEHLITRLAFTQELWAGLGREAVVLYRGMAVEGELGERAPQSFISATFSREVAAAHFDGGPSTETSALWRQPVPIARLVMTFLETREMNTRFREAEAVLIADAAARAF